MRMMSKRLGDISNDPTVTDTVDNTGMETLTFSTGSNVSWLALALIGAVLYFAFTPEKTRNRHFKNIKRKASETVSYARQKLANNI